MLSWLSSYLSAVFEMLRKMPGKKHETIKKRIASLVEIYLEHGEKQDLTFGV